MSFFAFPEPPQITEAGPSYSKREPGQTFEFYCRGTANSKVTWIKDGVDIDTEKDPKYEVLSNNNLKIAKVAGEMAGFYRCRLENEFGSNTLGWDLRLVVPCKLRMSFCDFVFNSYFIFIFSLIKVFLILQQRSLFIKSLFIDIDDEFKYVPRDNFFYPSKRQAWANCAAPDGDPRPAVTFINGTSGKPINVDESRISITMLARGTVLFYQMIVKDTTDADVSDKWACRASNDAGKRFSYFKVEYFSEFVFIFIEKRI